MPTPTSWSADLNCCLNSQRSERGGSCRHTDLKLTLFLSSTFCLTSMRSSPSYSARQTAPFAAKQWRCYVSCALWIGRLHSAASWPQSRWKRSLKSSPQNSAHASKRRFLIPHASLFPATLNVDRRSCCPSWATCCVSRVSSPRLHATGSANSSTSQPDQKRASSASECLRQASLTLH